jgi:hypothetical protein
MKFTGGSKEYSEKMSNEDFMAFKNGDLTKEEVIAYNSFLFSLEVAHDTD